MSLFNFAGLATTVSLSAAASNAATVTGSGVDLQDYNSPVLIVQNHGTSTGTLDGKIQDSADNSNFADVAGATFTQSTTTADVKMLTLTPRPGAQVHPLCGHHRHRAAGAVGVYVWRQENGLTNRLTR